MGALFGKHSEYIGNDSGLVSFCFVLFFKIWVRLEKVDKEYFKMWFSSLEKLLYRYFQWRHIEGNI